MSGWIILSNARMECGLEVIMSLIPGRKRRAISNPIRSRGKSSSCILLLGLGLLEIWKGAWSSPSRTKQTFDWLLRIQCIPLLILLPSGSVLLFVNKGKCRRKFSRFIFLSFGMLWKERCIPTLFSRLQAFTIRLLTVVLPLPAGPRRRRDRLCLFLNLVANSLLNSGFSIFDLERKSSQI